MIVSLLVNLHVTVIAQSNSSGVCGNASMKSIVIV